ncbi:MAG TPA: phosphoribosylaminoimidazolesuccinocarboxamide synthase [Nitrososphaerales archaeon]|nr:phosphoribosylaminoimidazolesuccinocarboxamide synthase [Nitrososphaerales archaeon]
MTTQAQKPPGRFIRSGKVKDIYEYDPDHLLFHFTDRVSAFDVVLPTSIPRKGEALCKMGAYWFETLGVPNHMVKLEGPNMMVVKKLRMIMVECIVRGYLYGSLFERVDKGEVSVPGPKVLATRLPAPYFDPTTKSEVHDEPLTEAEIVKQGLMTDQELKHVKASTIEVYEKMSNKAQGAGFILADLKLEFGKDEKGKILMADSIGPDEFRMWPANAYAPGKSQESYDKQPIRDWLQSSGYKARLDAARREGKPTPPPPELPGGLVDEVSRRYVHVYESITGRKLSSG